MRFRLLYKRLILLSWTDKFDFFFHIYISVEDEAIQVTNLLQGYVENEANLNKEGSCSGSCSDYKFARNRYCAPGTFCDDLAQAGNGSKNHICSGTIVDCIFFESDMKICPSVMRDLISFLLNFLTKGHDKTLIENF